VFPWIAPVPGVTWWSASWVNPLPQSPNI
jgi:hypothetical protein